MDTRGEIAWLHRRAGFGLRPRDVDAAVARGPAAELDRLVSATDAADPWRGVELDPEDGGRRAAVAAWITHMVATETPFTDRRAWMLHGWLVSSFDKVLDPRLMVGQIEMFREVGGGSYPDLLRAITIDPAMLVYLDGRRSTAAAPNENYARELLELFALGVGNYTEADVQALARALTGWVVERGGTESRFVARRHDDTPVTVLGTGGVADVDSAVHAVTTSEHHPTFVARRVVRDYLGDPDATALDGVVAELANRYDEHDRALDPLIADALRLGLDGHATPIVAAPIPWMVTSARTLDIDPRRLIRAIGGRVTELGQIPMLPPIVAGWPTGAEWLTASGLVARANVAAAIASATPPDAPARVAADEGDLETLATIVGLPEPFLPSTAAAVRAEPDPTHRLTLALVSPENLLT